MKHKDKFYVVKKYIDSVEEKAYPGDSSGPFYMELYDIILSLLFYPWKLWRRIVPFEGVVANVERVAYSDTHDFIISYVEVNGRWYDCLVDDNISVGKMLKRDLTGKIFRKNGEYVVLKKGIRAIM